MNTLYFADCLDVLQELDREHDGNGFIDLIYIDPPFNSKRNYNVLFESIDLKDSTAQKQAFADTWSNYEYVDTLKLIADLDKDLHHFLTALNDIRISDSAVAYLTTMSIRIHYMHKLLKDTGSFYLHCDPTMSHYLKLVCDLVFGEKNFQNEIIWKRTTAHNDPKRFGNIHDIILWYTKGKSKIFNKQLGEYSEEQRSRFKYKDEKGFYKAENLTAPHFSPTRTIEWRGIHPGKDRQWRFSIDKLEELYATGFILLQRDGRPRKDGMKEYLQPGWRNNTSRYLG